MTMKYPTHTQLTLPLLELMDESGGKARSCDLYQDLGHKLGLSTKEMSERDPKWNANIYHRHVRWAQQTLKEKGLINKTTEYSIWKLTERGKEYLQNCKPGVFITVFITPYGHAIWGEAMTVAKAMDDNMIDLHFTSPPYPLTNSKSYGNVPETQWIDWYLPYAEEMYRTLSPTGSFVINLGEIFKSDSPTLSIYIEKFVVALVEKIGFHLLGRFHWENPCKLPMSSSVTKYRTRVKTVTEPLFWLGKTPNAYANNRNILKDYSSTYLKSVYKEDFERKARPAGFTIARAFKNDNGGAIPGNIIRIPVTGCTDRDYLKKCKEYGVMPHDARMPKDLAKWFITFLTNTKGLVCDLMAGSAITALAAEELERPWIIGDKSLHFLRTGAWRFTNATINETLLKAAFNY